MQEPIIMRLPIYIVAMSLCFSPHLLADVFALKDGTKLEGNLIRETDTTYVVEVQVTKSIKDERVLNKEDVTSISESREDLEMFKKIIPMTPTPDGLTAEEYRSRIKFITSFLVEYDESPKAKEARSSLMILRTELNQIIEGAVKIGGVIITPEQRVENAYDIDAQVEALKIKRLIEERKFSAVLRAFDEFEKDYQLSSVYAELLPDIQKVITSYAQEVYGSLQTYDQRVANREEGLKQMSGDSRSDSEKAIEAQTEALRSRFDAEKSARQKWVSVHPYSKESLQYTMSLAKQEIKRLGNIDAISSTDGGKLYREYKLKFEREPDPKARARLASELKRSGLPERHVSVLQSFKPVAKEPAVPTESEVKEKPSGKKTSKD